MSSPTKKLSVNLSAPVSDLRMLGEQLQMQLTSTRCRLERIKSPELKVKALRSIDHAEYMFNNVSHSVQAIQRMNEFLTGNFGIDIDRVFALAGHDEQAARISTLGGMIMLNNGIALVLTDLAQLNMAIDKEQQHEDRRKNRTQ